jgi:dihydroorotate dehydrogenase (fumarate)
MTDLSTSYLGMALKTPIVASASPLSHYPETIQHLEEAGVSAVVMYSLFEEQIIRTSLELDYLLTHGAESFAEALNYLPDHGKYSVGPERYIEQIHELKRKVGIPVIGSLNGVSPGGWLHYARLIEEAGADALELNIYNIPTDPNITGADLEQGYVDLVRNVRAEIQIPLSIKLSPYFSSLPNLAWRLMEAGAQGLVLFNRFYQPDFDLENLEVTPNLQLSSSAELRLPLRWVALLYGRVPVDLALTSGVHTAQDVLKAMMAGAKVAMMTSALLKSGDPSGYVRGLIHELQTWITEREYESITQMQGSMAQRAVAQPTTYERSNYMKVLNSYPDVGPIIPDVTLKAGMLYPVD